MDFDVNNLKEFVENLRASNSEKNKKENKLDFNLIKKASSQTKNKATEIKLYTVKDLALIFKCNVAYIHQLRHAKLLKFIKLGQFKVTHETLEEFLKKYEGYDLTDPFNIKEL